MFLLHTGTIELQRFDHEPPPYAILSHRWRDEEVVLQDLASSIAHQRKGWAKLQKACEVAKIYGCCWLWMDTCCIDKTSSAELTEAINSMYNWYRKSAICLAYLDDVPLDNAASAGNVRFASSVWFKRGWTLQELIAPTELVFLTREWDVIGTKQSLVSEIANITGIDYRTLLTGRANHVNIATKLSWASDRDTTKIEDEAYCLLGIFGINMPTLYGESENAFIRLQEELIRKSSDDQSIFAWGMLRPAQTVEDVSRPSEEQLTQQFDIGLLAPSTRVFEELHQASIISIHPSEMYFKLGIHDPGGEIALTNYGTRLSLPLVALDKGAGVHLAMLACEDELGNLIGLYLKWLHGNRYARISDYNVPDLVSLPYSSLQGRIVPGISPYYVTRDPPKPFAVSVLAMINAESLDRFCERSGFEVAGSGTLANWSSGETCSFDVEELEPTYLLLRKRSMKLGILLAVKVEPERHQLADRNLFSLHASVLSDGSADLPYTEDDSAEATSKLIACWQESKLWSPAITRLTSVDIPDHGRLTLLLMCNTEPNWTNVDGYNDCRYTMTAHCTGQ